MAQLTYRAFRSDFFNRSVVMPALVAGIHVFAAAQHGKDVDGRDKPGHDTCNVLRREPLASM
jgi:hypothetical protein